MVQDNKPVRRFTMRYKDMPKIHPPTTDAYVYEHSVKGSAEPPMVEAGEEDSYSKGLAQVQWQLQDIKKDIQKIKDIVDAMDKNGLKMKPNW